MGFLKHREVKCPLRNYSDARSAHCYLQQTKESLSPSETGIANINGTRLCYETADTDHLLVLIHGNTLDTRSLPR